MTKSELIQRIAELNPHLYHRDVERIVTTVFKEISEALARGDRVELRGFGAFSVKQRDARVGKVGLRCSRWLRRRRARVRVCACPVSLEGSVSAPVETPDSNVIQGFFLSTLIGLDYPGVVWRKLLRSSRKDGGPGSVDPS